MRNGADKLAENAQCQKIMKTGGYVRIVIMRLDLKFRAILTPENAQNWAVHWRGILVISCIREQVGLGLFLSFSFLAA